MRITLAKHHALRLVWAILPPVARRAATNYRLSKRKPRTFN